MYEDFTYNSHKHHLSLPVSGARVMHHAIKMFMQK